MTGWFEYGVFIGATTVITIILKILKCNYYDNGIGRSRLTERERIYSGASLNVPEHWLHPLQRGCNWEHPRQYRLTMIVPDTFDCDEDDMNVLATTIYSRLRSESYTPDDIIYGTVYIGNENADKVIDFTKEDLAYICKQVLKTPNSKKRT